MAREQFFVLLHEGRWKIKHNGQHSRPYNTKVEAIKDAIDQAHDAQKKGCLSSVVVQSDLRNEDVELPRRGACRMVDGVGRYLAATTRQ